MSTQTSIPVKFNVGDTVAFTESFTEYPASAGWTAKLWLSLNGGTGTPSSVTASTNADGKSFDFTITQTVSAALAPGEYRYSEIVTNGTETHTPREGVIYALPNYTTAQTPTAAQAMVTLLMAVMQEFAGTTRTTVSFNGQSFTRASIKEYQEQLTYWQARVLAEQRAVDRLRNGRDPAKIAGQFEAVAGGTCSGSFPSFWPWRT